MIPELRPHDQLAAEAQDQALKGRHDQALAAYQQALRNGRSQKAHAIVLRHYSECALESLEHLERYDKVLSYCDAAISHYTLNPPCTDLTIRDLAELHQRRAIVLAKLGEQNDAAQAAETAIELAQPNGFNVALAGKILSWITAGYHIDRTRLLQEQYRHKYFSVRRR